MRTVDARRADGKQVYLTELSVMEYADAFSRPVHPANQEHADQCTGHSFRPAWTGDIKSLPQARATLETGWKAGADKLTRMSNTIDVPAARTRRRVSSWSDDGADLDVDRAMRGDERSWRTTRRQWSQGPAVVDLIGFFGGNCSRDAEAMFWSGATSIVLADVLENAGYGVRILAVNVVHSNHNAGHVITSIVVKEESEPVRIDALASIMCHAGTYRTHGFRTTCAQPIPLGWGLGQNIGQWSETRNPAASLHAVGFDDSAMVKIDQVESLDACKREVARVLASFQ